MLAGSWLMRDLGPVRRITDGAKLDDLARTKELGLPASVPHS